MIPSLRPQRYTLARLRNAALTLPLALGVLALNAPSTAAWAQDAPLAESDAQPGASVVADAELTAETVDTKPEILPIDFEAELSPLTRDRLFRDSRVGVQVVRVADGESVFSRESAKPLVPASTVKVLTAATALKVLGPAYRYTTDLYSDGEVDQAGVLRGNLYIKGHGDPTLVVEKLWKLVYDLKLEGIDRISGNVVFDEGYFDSAYRMPGWGKQRDIVMGPSYFATSSALSLNFNTVTLVVGPGTEVGKAARVRLETAAGGYVTVENEVSTGAIGSRRQLEIKREVTAEGMTFTLTGSIPSDDDARRYYRTVEDPTEHFIAAWTEMEKVHGITVSGKHIRGETPVSASLISQHRSVPLTAVLMDMNKYSNNFMAEQVLKTLGAEAGGAPGTVDKGLAAVGDYLTEIGVPKESFTLHNGSGLSREARLTPGALTSVMVDMANDDKVGNEFKSSLSIAGGDGTLWRRMAEEPGRVRGKTGTIDGVHCLTGYVTARDGELYAFSFLVNDLRGGSSPAKRLHDRFLRRMFNAADL
ncbi:MAG: D-alanyl-D-alanine carboxypeptidase/D-alanyl-D-alanine-endopeptidase [Myxococcota bacterium]